MLTKAKRGWELPESAATPEALVIGRRAALRGLAAGLLAAGGLARAAHADEAAFAPQTGAVTFPFPHNQRIPIDRPITKEATTTTYNNYYEFSTDKDLSRLANRLKTSPWAVTIGGLVEAPITIDAQELMAKLPREERIYRHRCVEAWSITVPWEGAPLAELVKFAKPLGSAKYLRMETFLDPAQAPGQRQFWYPWPYVEGLTMAEATNEIAFLSFGAYGKPLVNSMGAPLRLTTPWKYGFKSVKAIAKFTFTEERPKTYWEALAADEYGFWANVNPKVPHPRWSQATERVIGTDERVPTLLFNGYGPFVADLYAGNTDSRLYM